MVSEPARKRVAARLGLDRRQPDERQARVDARERVSARVGLQVPGELGDAARDRVGTGLRVDREPTR